MPRAAAHAPTGPGAAFATDVERYRDNWVRHLLGIAHDLERRVVTRLAVEGGYAPLRASQGPVLSLVWNEPRPLMQLAQALSISRQACTKLVQSIEQSGYVERVDGERAQQVRLTRRGRQLVREAVRMILEAQSAYADRVGKARLDRFITAAASVFFDLGLHEQTDPTLGETARRSIGVLPLIARRVEEELRETTRAKGHDVLQLSHARLIALIGHEGARVSELSRLQGVSRQATSATVRSIETLGYARREADESDGRGVRVVLTRRGRTLIGDSLSALDELEGRFRGILGTRRWRDLRDVAADLHATLLAEDETLDVAVAAATGRITPSEPELRGVAERLVEHLGPEASSRLGDLLRVAADARRA
ncbi:MAG: MarR family transcriptional regulator [bacterium]|nr:MarR family transcriptional regulator [bacterium]